MGWTVVSPRRNGQPVWEQGKSEQTRLFAAYIGVITTRDLCSHVRTNCTPEHGQLYEMGDRSKKKQQSSAAVSSDGNPLGLQRGWCAITDLIFIKAMHCELPPALWS